MKSISYFGASPQWVAGICLMISLSACKSTSVEGYLNEEAQALPTKWKNASSARPLQPEALQTYWTRFSDPVLNQIIQESLQSSLDVQTSLSRIREAKAQLGVEQSVLLPRIGANVDGQGRSIETRSANLKTSTETWTASSSFNWELDIFGKNWERRKASKANLQKAEEDFYHAQVLLSSQVAEAYINYRRAEAQLKVAEESIRISEETANFADWRQKAGTGNALDALQVNSGLEQTRAQIPNLRRVIEEASNQLSVLSGKTPGSWKTLLSSSGNRMKNPGSVALGVPADLMRQRPDLRSAERALQSSISSKRVAQLERLPTFDLTGSIGVNAAKAAKLFSPEQTIATLATGLTAPIFEGGRLVSSVRVQEEREAQALLTYKKALITSMSEVENAVYAVRRLDERLTILARAERLASDALTLAQQQFQVGRVDLMSVLEAQRTLIGIRNDIVSSKADLHVAHVDLFKALGGGWLILP